MYQLPEPTPTIIETIETIMRDPIWQGIGVMTAVILGLISILAARRQYKDVYCKIESAIPLTTSPEHVPERLQILHEGEIIKEAKLVLIKLRNIGNVPITSSDYESPIKISVDSNDENARILDASVTKASPTELMEVASVAFDSKSVQLSPLLLNPGDTITLKLITAVVPIDVHDFGYKGMSISGRIAGVKKIRDISKFSLVSFIFFIIFMTGLGIYFYLLGIGIIESTSYTNTGRVIKVLGFLVLVGVVINIAEIVFAKLKKMFPILEKIEEMIVPPTFRKG